MESLPAFDKTSYRSRLFELRATGIIEARVTCDLDDRVLAVSSPPFSRADGRYGWMRYSPNVDERRVAEYVVDRLSSCSEEHIFHLSFEEASDLAGMLDREGLREADGMDDAKMTELYRCHAATLYEFSIFSGLEKCAFVRVVLSWETTVLPRADTPRLEQLGFCLAAGSHWLPRGNVQWTDQT